MRRIIIILALLISSGIVFAQTHFTPIWSGSALDQMNFNVTSATIDEVGLQTGDEVGIFDGVNCVGVGVVTTPGDIIYVITSKDDPDTPELDGYIVGHPATVKMWDASAGTEIIEITMTIASGAMIFEGSASTLLSLAGTTCLRPDLPGAMTGNSNPCQGATGITYSVPVESDVDTYTWTVPSDWSITGGDGTSVITVTVGTSSGDISVEPSNTCGTGYARTLAVTVNTIPAQPGVITGSDAVCLGSVQIYSIVAVDGATSYTWTLPSGWTGSSDIESISATTDVNGGTIYVTANNVCGDSDPGTLDVTALTVPEAPTVSLTQPDCGETTGTITITAPLESGMTYSIDGVTYTNTTGSFDQVASNTYSVTAKNAAGCVSQVTDVSIDPQPVTPVTPVITQNVNTLHSDAVTGNQWYNQDGIIVGATDQDYTADADGNYYVVVSNGSCSSLPSNIINVVLTRLEQIELSNAIKIYPNPTTGKVILSVEGKLDGKVEIDVLDILGHTLNVARTELSENQTVLNFDGYSKGTYLISIKHNGYSIIKTVILK